MSGDAQATVRSDLAGDFWGGLAAMLVALPAAIAFGVTIYSPLGGSYASQGAFAGILGAAALGIIAASFGGTRRLITAPCAPAAAVLSALAAEHVLAGASPESVVLTLTLIGLFAGLLQVGLGLVGVGRLIRYVPYPVVSGYLSAVGMVLIGTQIPKFLGSPVGTHFWTAMISPALWRWQAIGVGLVVIVAMVFAPRLTGRVPAAILALVAGLLAYFGFGLGDPALLRVEANPLIVGPLGGGGGGLLATITDHWRAFGQLGAEAVMNVFVPALTLAALLSIDTLKTCVVVDAVTRSRHDSNRELIGQGLGNLVSSACGGLPGAGQMGATMINVSSGGVTRRSGMIEGGLALVAVLVLSPVLAWVPVAALAAILMVVGFRMIDWSCVEFLRSKSTRFDFVVIAAVVVVALAKSLIAASGVGIGLAILLFIREQTRSSVVHARVDGSRIFSKHVRHQHEMEILEQHGEQTVIVELQGSLFFGTASQLYTALEPEIGKRRFVILNLRRVQSIDVTAGHVLEGIEDMLREKGGTLIFAEIPRDLPSGMKMKKYLKELGLVRQDNALAFRLLDDALEWVEAQILAEARATRADECPLELRELEIFNACREETLAALESCIVRRSVKSGDLVFRQGDSSRELYLIRRGEVRLALPVTKKQGYHLATFGRGDFFGEMAFLDGSPRSAEAVAVSDADFYVLDRDSFDRLAGEHKAVALSLFEGFARVLAMRLRYTLSELRVWRS